MSIDNFSYCADIFCKSGGRALGAIISKIQNHKDVGFKTYTKIHYSCVVPVTDNVLQYGVTKNSTRSV
jgi:hypothetical protein